MSCRVRCASRWTTASSCRPRSTCPTARPAPAVHPRGAALPQGRPHLVVRAGVRPAARRARVRRLPPRPARHRLVRRRTRPTSTRRGSSGTSTEVIAWLADQDWCDGSVGMYGTSYSGFNSLQMACERPPELKAIIAIYAQRRPLHRRRALPRRRPQVLDLVDYCHYMTPMNALPPVPARLGRRLARRVGTRGSRRNEPWALTWLREQLGRSLLAARLGPPRTTSASPCPTMVIAGWADGYRNNSFRTDRAAARNGVPHRLLAGPGRTRRPRRRSPDRGSTRARRWSPGGTAGCAGRQRRRRRTLAPTGADLLRPLSTRRPGARDRHGALGAGGVAVPAVVLGRCDRSRRRPPTPSGRTSVSTPGSTAPGTCPGG